MYMQAVLGLLSGCYRSKDLKSYCILQLFERMQGITNSYDCPLLELTNALLVVESKFIVREISVVHECTASCKYVEKHSPITVERELFNCNQLVFEHDYSNQYFCFNIYAIRH